MTVLQIFLVIFFLAAFTGFSISFVQMIRLIIQNNRIEKTLK
jgi:hypothetical protein